VTPSISPEAELELIDAARYYAHQATPELGAEFINAFEQAVELLSARPQLGAPWRGRRRFPLQRFPYSIIYYTAADSLRVIAVAHHRRHPQYWATRR
jgi:plasmid stabilization system protein ParE